VVVAAAVVVALEVVVAAAVVFAGALKTERSLFYYISVKA
jgi:hypothetical protein